MPHIMIDGPEDPLLTCSGSPRARVSSVFEIVSLTAVTATQNEDG